MDIYVLNVFKVCIRGKSEMVKCLENICPLSSRPARLPLLTPGYLMFFENIGPDSERQRENGTNQTIRWTWVGINCCFHFSLLKSALPNPFISTTRSTALQTCVISSEHFISILCPPSPPPTTSIIADDFFSDKTRTISSQFSPPHTQDLQPTRSTAQTPIFSFCPLTEAEVSKLLLSSHPTTCPLDPIPSDPLQAISPTLLPAQHSQTSSTHLSSQASSPRHSSRLG